MASSTPRRRAVPSPVPQRVRPRRGIGIRPARDENTAAVDLLDSPAGDPAPDEPGTYSPDVGGPTTGEPTVSGHTGSHDPDDDVDDLEVADADPNEPVTDSPDAESSAPGADASTVDELENAASGDEKTRGRWGLAVLTVAVFVLLMSAGATTWFLTRTSTDTGSGPLANAAMADAAGTTEVVGQLTQAVEQVFSYTHTDLPKTERAMRTYLTGKAVGQYEDLFSQLKIAVPQQKLTLQTTVRAMGVVSLHGDRAEVLAFLDQRAIRDGAAAPSSGGGQLKVIAVKDNGSWKVSDFVVL